MALLHSLLSWDADLFHFINSSLSNPMFDYLLPWCREKWFWAPVYLFIAVFVLLNYPQRGWIVLLGLIAVVFISDGVSSELIKKNVRRLRPCNDPALSATVQLRTDCGSGFSFTSSHASNHFAVAIFLVVLLGHLHPWGKPVALSWAALIAFSQVYVGVHFPGDVICGGLFGLLVGWVIAKLLEPMVQL